MESNKKTPKKETTASPGAKKRPENVIRIEDVSVSIFRFTRSDGSANFSCSFQRSYKDASNTWKRTQWFGLDDLGKVVASAQQADAWIRGQLEKQDA